MNKKKTEKLSDKEEFLSHVSIKKEISLLIDNMVGLEDYRLPQMAYHVVRLAIRDLILPPGTTILEREMAEVLQMSRTPVREALVRLETEGMVHLVPRRGFIVKPIEGDDLKKIYEIVETLDGLSVRLATEKVGEAEIASLETSIELQEQALEENNLKKWARLDDQFHHQIIDYTKNNRLRAIIDTLSDQIYRARLFTIANRPVPFKSIVEHKAIIACMMAKDGNAASVLMQSHRNRARNEILGVISE